MHHAIKKLFAPVAVVLCFIHPATAQFAPAADLPGTTAIRGDSSVFVEWASGCLVHRGLMNIADTSLGAATAGSSSDAIGAADVVTVSLGDGGTATLTFDHPVYNGPGFDFAVFENGFMVNNSNLAFLELAFIEVSTDGVHFVRFPAVTDVQDTAQLNNDGATDCSQLYNLAGKYIARYGTPFDLQELADSPGIDINNINYVKVIDVVGSIDPAYATYDHNGHIINDPWPTPFASCGFDLDAIGVINAKGITDVKNIEQAKIDLYPNPVRRGEALHIHLPENTFTLRVFDMNGQMLDQIEAATGPQTISTEHLSPGVYLITAENDSGKFNTKLVVE